MKLKNLVLLLICIIFLNPVVALAEKPGDINYNRTEFRFGQAVYFNFGDCMAEEFDRNGYLFPRVYKDTEHIKRGIFINIEDYGFPPGEKTGHLIATVAYIDRYGKGATITRHVIKAIPQQKTIVLNW